VRRRVGKLGLAVVMSMLVAASAVAYWTTSGSGTATGSVGTLVAPVIDVPATAGSSVLLSISSQATTLGSSDSEISYRVQRKTGAGAFADVSTGACSGDLGHGTLSCTDTPPESATYTYRVIAAFRSWTATSNSASVVASVGPAAPVLTSTIPSSPATSTAPKIVGSADAGTTVKLYTDSDCSAGSLAASGSAADLESPGIEVTVGANSTTTFYATATDEDDQVSACSTTSVTYVADNTAPAKPDVTSTAPSPPSQDLHPEIIGSAEFGTSVRVYTTSDCSGAPAATGSATAFANPGLTVTVGENSTTTFYATATDAAGNTSDCSTTSVTYVADNTGPDRPDLTATDPASPSQDLTPLIVGAAESGSTVKLYLTSSCTGTPVAMGSAATFASPGIEVTVVADSTTTFYATATDGAGNASPCSTASQTYVSDNTGPAVTVNEKAGQADPTNTLPIRFTVHFTENVSDFTSADVTRGGTATTASANVSVVGSGKDYEIVFDAPPAISEGSITAVIAAGAAHDVAGNGGSASTSTDNSVTYDTTGPTVTVEQKAGQADPTNAPPIRFTVVFSEGVSDFDASDVTRGGTAGGGTVSVTGSGTTYEISVSGLTSDGTVTASIGSGQVHDAAGNGTSASTSTDNSVTVDTTGPSVTVEQKIGQGDPTRSLPILFTVTFSEPVTGFSAGDLDRGGSATGGSVAATGSGAGYEIAVTDPSNNLTNGSITFSLPAGSAQDAVGNGNLASTSTDNSVTYDTIAPTLASLQLFDTETPPDGKPDQVKAIFNEALGSYGAANGIWTLVNAPGGTNTLPANPVSIAGATASISITENAVNTSSGTWTGSSGATFNQFTMALASDPDGIKDLAGNVASFATTNVVDKANPIPSSLTFVPKGNGDNIVNQDDQIVVAFSEPLKQVNLCSTWTATNTADRAIAGNNNEAQFTIANNSSASSTDVFRVSAINSGVCDSTFRFGSVDLGSNAYVTADQVINGGNSNASRNEIRWVFSSRTLTFEIGSGGTSNAVGGTPTATYTPTSGMTDLADNPASNTASNAAAGHF
jgi:hypothetical protein